MNIYKTDFKILDILSEMDWWHPRPNFLTLSHEIIDYAIF